MSSIPGCHGEIELPTASSARAAKVKVVHIAKERKSLIFIFMVTPAFPLGV
jgi:hypothetical protein